MITSTLLSLLLPALVSAHGYVNKVSIDGTVYQGNAVGTTPTTPSVIRQVNTNSPIKGATNADLSCGAGAQPAADVADANPGSTVEVSWVGGTTGTSPWPHNTGPVMHYMAKCQDSCTTADSNSAQWFKISEESYQSGTTTWSQAQLQSGSPTTVTIPSSLAPGDYLLRSELIALQLAMTEGGAEFYPACIQLSVGGSGTGQPTSSEEVSFPGGYSDTDPGILTPDVYNPGFTYTFPGPSVAALASGGTSTGSSAGSGSSSAAAAPSPSAASPAASPSAPTVPSPSAASPSASSVAPSSASTPSAPANVGGNPPASAASATPSATSTGGSGSPCTSYKRSFPEARVVVDGKRMHRRRYRTSH